MLLRVSVMRVRQPQQQAERGETNWRRIEIGTEETIRTLKYFISRNFGIPRVEQKLVYRGRVLSNLDDDLKIVESGMEDGSDLTVLALSNYRLLEDSQQQRSTLPNFYEQLKNRIVEKVSSMTLEELDCLSRFL